VGARAVQVGTAHFIHPHAAIDILEGIEDYLEQHQFDDINQLIGTLKTGGETC
jgi:dihydroorotate dehydrogenase (NAD+) catalytic subunit